MAGHYPDFVHEPLVSLYLIIFIKVMIKKNASQLHLHFYESTSRDNAL